MNQFLIIICLLFSFSGCSSAKKPLESHGDHVLDIQKTPTEDIIKAGTYKGCEILPGTPPSYKERWWHKFTFADQPIYYSGESCAITITEDHKVSVSFVSQKNLPIVYTVNSNAHYAEIEKDVSRLTLWHTQGRLDSVSMQGEDGKSCSLHRTFGCDINN